MDIMAQKLEDGSGRIPHEEPDPARAVPLQVGDGLGIRFRRLPHRHAQGDAEREVQGAARRAEGEAGSLPARRDARRDGDRRRVLHRDRRRRPVARLRHPRHRDVRLGRDPHPSDRQRHLPARHQVAGAGARDHLRADHRDRARHRRPTTSWWRKATPTRRLTVSAPTARARRRCRAPRPRWPAARSRPRRR